MKTRSVYGKSPWQFEVREVELPEPREGQVLLKVEACGICGSDLTAVQEKMNDWKAFGHEIAGIIVQLGPGCDGLEVGGKVVLESGSFCGRCAVCRNGRVDLCRNTFNFWGQPAMGFSEYMLAPARCAVPYDGLTPEVACMAEPAGVAYDMVKTAGIQMGDNVCLVGPGPIGLKAIPLAFSSGAARVVCVGRKSNGLRLKVARKLGAETIAHDGGLTELKDLNKQFDVVLMTAPARFIPDAFSLLAYGGRMSYIGFGADDGTIQFDANDFHRRKLELRASFASPGIYIPHVLRYMMLPLT